jgi:hypothetical protein
MPPASGAWLSFLERNSLDQKADPISQGTRRRGRINQVSHSTEELGKFETDLTRVGADDCSERYVAAKQPAKS